MVDDQYETYSRELLSQIKHNHEEWVSEKLRDDKKEIKPLRIIRNVANIPEYLTRISNGTEFMTIIDDACGFYFSYDELDNEQEVDLVSNFIQTIQDYTDINSFFEAGDKVKAAYALNRLLTEMDDAGFVVFAQKENQTLEGGIGSSTDFPVFRMLITKKTNENIIIES